MTSRERVLAAVAHKTPDRTPMDFWARNDVRDRLMGRLEIESVEALYERLGIDLRVVPMEEHIASFESRTTGTLHGHSASAGKRFVIHEDGRFENAWGVVQRLGSDGLYDEWVSGPFVEDRDLDAFDWPTGDIYDSVETLRGRVASHGGRYATLAPLELPFKTAWRMRGLENFLCDMLIDRTFARELLERVAAYEVAKGKRFAAAGADIVGIYGDLAMQDRMLVQPKAWRETEKPILARMIAEIRAVKPDLLIFFHSDGDVGEIVQDYIDVGADILNPIQPECMDPAEVKRKYGDRLTLHGTISIQKTLPRGTPDDVRKEVRARIETCGKDGGLILCPSNLIQNDTPLENILALYDAPREA